MSDLEETIALNKDALELRTRGRANRCLSLNDLAIYLSTRYNRLRQLVDLDEAIIANREALQYHAPGHPDRFISMNNLAICFSTRDDHLPRQDTDK